MSFMKLRKKKTIQAGCIGGAIVLIPALILIIYLLVFYPIKVEERQQTELEKQLVVLYQTNGEIFADKIISEKDLKKCVMLKDQAPKGSLTKEKILGKRAKIALSEQTVLTGELLYKGSALTDDIRLQYYDYIRLSDKLKKGDRIDIRIVYPDGTDFIILSKKEILDLDAGTQVEGETKKTENSRVWLEVSEEEILRISSAVVDASNNENTCIYAIAYKEDIQKSAIANYPVNDAVAKLIKQDPNIVEKASNVVESNLRSMVVKTLEKEKNKDSLGVYEEEIEEIEETKEDQKKNVRDKNEKNSESIQYLD